jgi:serine/threonine-protein kinase
MNQLCAHCRTTMPAGSRFCPTCGADSSDPGAGPRTSGTGAAELVARLKAAVGDRYEIRQQLGRGGMGAVYLAVDRRLDRDVAIKVLPLDLAHDEQFVRRFEHEARTAARLDHPGIIPIYAVEAAGDLHYFVMKYVNGRSLESVIASGPLPVDLAQRILWEAACALGHAHQRGVVHRDVKPANVMLDEQGRVLLTDFGISKALQSASSFTATGQVIGTPHYMSPEQAKGAEVGGASDQYSLAVVGYKMLTGHLPFEEDSVHTVIYKHVWERPPAVRTLRADIPPFLADAIDRAMAKQPDARFPTMESFATAVWPENPVEAAGGTGARAVTRRSVSSTDAPTEVSQPTARRVAQPPPRRRARWPVALVSALVVMGGGAAALAFTPPGRRLLRQAGLAAPADTVAAPLDSATLAPVVRAPPPAPAETTAVDPTDSTPPAPVRRPERESARPPATPPATRDPAPAVPQVGFLTIDATPSGVLLVDGREIGDTPRFRLELRPGAHTVEIRREGFKPYLESIQITVGNVTLRRVTLQPEGS